MSLPLPSWNRRAHRPRATFISLLLLATLGLAGLLARQAQVAASSHRAVAERTLTDYAAFAAWKSAGVIKSELYWIYGMALQPLFETNAANDSTFVPYPAAFVVPPEKTSYIPPRLVVAYFRMDLRQGCIATRGSDIPSNIRTWMTDTLAVHARTVYQPDWKMASITGIVDGHPYTLVYVLDKDNLGVPRAAIGFKLNPRALPPILARLNEEARYLPPSLVGDLTNDELLSVSVKDGLGQEIYHSPQVYADDFAAEDSVGTALGGMTVHVALRPEVASKLLIGGLPHSRLPMLLGLLALTAGLVAAALLQHRREYELAALRSEFVSNVSHELRTPLAQIRMFAETLLLGRVRSPEERVRSLEIIDQEARRLTHLVENVLHFSRSERRAIRVAPESTDLSRLVREVVDGFRPLARARQTTVKLELEEGITAWVDQSALRQVLLNLLDNAVKYGPPGQTVTVATSAGAGRVWIRVDDEGPGIPEADRERIWDRFSRLEREAASAVAGTGIGLAVVRDLVRLHGGRVWADEAPSGGARFIVELPVASAAGHPAAPSGDASADGKGAGAEMKLPAAVPDETPEGVPTVASAGNGGFGRSTSSPVNEDGLDPVTSPAGDGRAGDRPGEGTTASGTGAERGPS
jgi:signal transduction histidine kinase